ncbi:MAG: type II toxin-antitoxin system Phd/YefM family antitoxin [Gaiellaceae bacterium]
MDVAREIAAGKFKAQCLALLDRVAATGEEIVVTKRGKPVARVLPVEEPPSLLGSIVYNVSDEELIAPLDDWEVDKL